MTTTREKGTKTENQSLIPFAMLLGTLLEGYDFAIYGTSAALIFNKQFFPSASPGVAIIASFATFAVGFAARPIGGLLFGHFGDRIGRKHTLVVSLTMMGISTTAIGLLPSFAAVGILAPIILVALRIVQGVALGGEAMGATLMSLEHAPAARRNFYAGFPQMGTPGGLVVANLVILLTTTLSTDAAYEAWVWRLPFLFSIILVAVGIVVRLKIAESPAFVETAQRNDVVKVPLKECFKLGLPRMTVTLFAAVASGAIGYVFMVFSLAYGTSELGFDRQFMVTGVTLAAAIWALCIPCWTSVADRYGRRKMFVAGSIAIIVGAALFIPMINTGSKSVTIAAFVIMGLVMPITHSVQQTIVADAFPANVRYTGSSLIMQTGAILGPGLAPMIAATLVDATGSSASVIIYTTSIGLLSLVSALVMFRIVPSANASGPVGTPSPITPATEEGQVVVPTS